MMTLATFVGSIPPASLAKADLPRFLVRALGRRNQDELPTLIELLDGATLVGYPAVIAPTLRAFTMRMVAEDRDPQALDPDVADHILGTPAFLRLIASDLELEQIILRPGTPVSAEVRVLLDGRLVHRRGVGPQLVLVGPIEVIRLPGMTWSVLRSAPLARPMALDEMEALRDAWARIEERVGWPSEEALGWEASFVEIASRPNDDALSCAEVLRALTPFQRRKVWRGLIEHLRDQELPEDHRPGPRGVQQRLASVGTDLDMDAVTVLRAVADSAYQACSLDPRVREGYCPVRAEDLERYSRWIEVPDATRERLRELNPSVIAHGLRQLAGMEAGLLQMDQGEAFTRDIRAFRDGYLSLRYRRDVSVLLGVDPIGLVEELLANGLDRRAILSDLKDLVKRITSDVPVRQERAASGPSLREILKLDPRVGAKAQPLQSTKLPRREFPPMPEPPPARPTPGPRRRAELPPLPDMPPPRPHGLSPARVRPPGPPPPPPLPEKSHPGPAREVAPAPQADRTRTPSDGDLTRPATLPHLVTPGQGIDFYEEAFRELQVLERDLLERGGWPEARARVTYLGDRASSLAAALGPPARSGDDEFRAALNKVDFVLSYIERIQPLLETVDVKDVEDGEILEDVPFADEDRGVMNKLGRLFKGD
jgi:hypothetical protein